MAESLWDVKEGLEGKGSGLVMRIGKVGDVVSGLIDGFNTCEGGGVIGVWMTSEEGQEEQAEESDVKKICQNASIEFKSWWDEKYLIDE